MEQPSGVQGLVDRWFHLRERGTTVRTEVIGGATTFIAMAYIIVVNPAILKFAGIPEGPSTVATILAAVFGTLLMGLYANRPIAVAPYMGENAFIAFGLATMGIGWEMRLGAVFIGGAALAVLAVLRVRTWLANSISRSMKHSFAAGIGLFLLLIGLYETGIITSFVSGMPAKALLQPDGQTLRTPDVPLKIGDLRDPAVQLAIAGFVLMSVLLFWRVRGAILIGMAVTAVAGYLVGLGKLPTGVVAPPWDEKHELSAIAFKLDIRGILQPQYLPILLTLFLMSFLDTLGTLVGVGSAGNLLDEHGNFPEVERPMLVDAASCMFGSVVGTSTCGAFIESATGIREGARTGLAAVITAALFALALFFLPLAEPLQSLRFAYGPALMAVGVLMVGSIRHVDFEDLSETVPALATIGLMSFSYNIANGLTAGLVLYPLLKVVCGRFRDLNSGAVLLGVVCLIYYVFGMPH